MDTLADMYADDPSSSLGSDLSTILNAYASLQFVIQRTPNPSGTFDDLSGLGEPKFGVDGTAFTGSWGRPQRDGPALRALTLMHYLRAYNASQPWLWGTDEGNRFFGPFYTAVMPANSLIKVDLEYVAKFWNFTSFDLWEEVEGLHFFNLIVSARSLREGAKIARAFSDHGAAKWYVEQAGYIEHLLSKFWNAKKGHLVETLWSKRSGLDCGILLGSLHALPKNYGREDEDNSNDSPAIFPPWSDEILISLLALTRDQARRHPINNDNDNPASNTHSDEQTNDDSPPLRGIGIGRYPEDIYDGYSTSEQGGNPWFLCTSSAAEILYRTATHMQSCKNISISHTNLPFYKALLQNPSSSPHSSPLQLSPRSLDPSDALFHTIIQRLIATADQFLAVVQTHVDEEGSMSEQFDRVTGYMRGAEHLTWSYGAFLEAVRARKGAKKALESLLL